ncbi:unnamed protein product [Arabidopsis halleri]
MDGGVPNMCCLDFVRKVYEMVDDPSTDSIISWGFNGDSFIVWNSPECLRDLFPRLLGVKDFGTLTSYGFKKVALSGHLEYANDYFVRGKPELLEKIGQSFIDAREKRMKPLIDGLLSCKSYDERDLFMKEWNERKGREQRAKMDKALLKDADLLLLRIAREKERRANALASFMGIK